MAVREAAGFGLMLRVLLCGVLWGAALPAQAWGVKGHATVAALAQSALSDTAQQAVERLLAEDLDREGRPSGRRTLAAVASWADEIRDMPGAEKTYRGWHVRANPVCSAEAGPCRDGHCVDQLILHYADILGDTAQPPRARNEALKWVVHLVGDLHQPLHSGVAADRGSLKVSLSGLADKPARTLHQVWDTELAVLALKQGPLRLPRPLPVYVAGAVDDWMQESRALAQQHAYAALPGFSCEAWAPSTEVVALNEAYVAQALPVIRLQMQRAAARLAALLNAELQ